MYEGDTLYAESICTDARESASRPNVGIISMKTRGLNQDGEEIMSYKRTVMIAKRSSGIGQNYFPKAKNGEITA
jgi:acyl dehydratase